MAVEMDHALTAEPGIGPPLPCAVVEHRGAGRRLDSSSNFFEEIGMLDTNGDKLSRRCLLAGGMACVGLVLATVPWGVMAQASPEVIATQSTSDQGVTVRVTPKSIGRPDSRWEFMVVLDTHSADLSDDLTRSATLVTDEGRAFRPVSWQGAPPGGHHREGVLAFDVPAPRPDVIELRIARQGESAPRVFRWKF